GLLSGIARRQLAEGAAIDRDAYREALRAREGLIAAFAAWAARFDGVLTPAATGEAPTPETTGDPRFATRWSLIGAPAIAIPSGLGLGRLPLGLPIVAAPGDDQPPVPSRITVGLSSYATVSSFSVPMPPEIMITASAARTVRVFRIQPMPVVIAMSTNSFASRLSNPGRMPMTRPFAFLAPRLAASITPDSPPLTRPPERSATS